MSLVWCFFFFQAEDGIRDHCVTGVQACALPISPRLGLEQAEETKLWGEGFGREAGVYPSGVRSEDFERFWRAVLFRGGGDPAEPDCTGETVELQGATPDQLREAPMPGATSQLHLEEAVLGVDVALGEEQVSLAFGEDLGHPKVVPQDLDGAFEARKVYRAVECGQRPAQ